MTSTQEALSKEQVRQYHQQGCWGRYPNFGSSNGRSSA